MSRSFTTAGLSKFIEDNIEAIEKVRREVEEIQVGFQSSYVDWRVKHDASLAALHENVLRQPQAYGAGLQLLIDQQLRIEQNELEKRKQSLKDEIIPKYQSEMDRMLAQGRQKTQESRQLNPKLDKQEEILKARLAESRRKLAELNDEIGQHSRGLGGILHFVKLGELDRQRQRLIGQMEDQQKSLLQVRKDWDEYSQVIEQEENSLKAQWQQAASDLAQRQAELSYLEDPASLEKLAYQRAVHSALDNLKTQLDCPDPALKASLDQMVENNIQTDDYQAGLATVGGLIGMLGSIQEGLKRFNTSVESLSEQERMHSQYLKPLEIRLPDPILDFFRQWEALLKKVSDEKTICAHPAEFARAMQPVIEGDLSPERLKTVFEGMGEELKVATQDWK